MKVEIDKETNEVVIRLPIEKEPKDSASGKTKIIASSSGRNITTESYEGKQLMVTASVYYRHNFFAIDIYLLYMKSENIVCEEWKGYRPNMAVKVVGVSNGKITSNGNGVEIFKNLKDAQKKYSDLDARKIPNDLLG